MARPDQQRLFQVIQTHLEPGEQVRRAAMAYRRPTMWLIIPLVVLAVLPGLIAQQLLTKFFVIALTDRRLLILRYKGKFEVQEVREFRLGQIPPIRTATGPVHIDLTLEAPSERFFCQFHRAVAQQNKDNALAIIAGLQTPGMAGARPAAVVVPPPAPAAAAQPRVPPVSPPATVPPSLPSTPTLQQAPPPLPVAATASAQGMSLRLGSRRFNLQPDTSLCEDDIAGLLSKAENGVVAAVDRNPNNPEILGLKNLSTSAWSLTLPDGETREHESGRSVKLARGTRIGFGFCDGVIEV